MPGPDHPPGYYGPSGAARAFNLITAKTELASLAAVEGASAVSGYTLKKPVALEPWLYIAALALFALDILAVLALSAGLRFRRRAATAAAILFALALLSLALPSPRRGMPRRNCGSRAAHAAPRQTISR